MTTYDYALAVGSDQTTLTNIETIISNAPVGKIIPLGSVRRRTLNQHIQSNGAKNIEWFFGAMTFDDFETLMLFIFGNWATENQDLTIDTRGSDEVFHRGNVVANRPVEGEDYTRRDHGKVEGLRLTLRDFQEITSNGFSTGFDFGFTA